jgi:hypothetical protein
MVTADLHGFAFHISRWHSFLQPSAKAGFLETRFYIRCNLHYVAYTRTEIMYSTVTRSLNLS